MTPSDQAATDDLLTRGVAEIIEPRHLEQRLRRRQPLRIKYGIDPTGFDIHLGHVVPLRKLRAWQKAGHQAVIIIGDYTAQVGDPSGRDTQRLSLTAERVKDFAAGYLDQLGRILDLKRTEVRYNSEWFGRMSPAEFMNLIRPHTLQQLLAHETFRQRFDKQAPLTVLELLYPILQGYDSVMVKADVELGGIDQKFNLLTGRLVQQQFGQEPQDVMMMPYLTGLDGKQKMSKSLKNYIGVADEANDMFGKIMSLPDKLIPQYAELVTELPAEEIAAMRKTLRGKKKNPRDLKIELARAVVGIYHSPTVADQAAAEFSSVFSKKHVPSSMPTAEVKPGQHVLLNLLVSHQLAGSRSEARRLIEQGGVKVDKQVVMDWEQAVTVHDGTIIQVGKRKFLKLISTG